MPDVIFTSPGKVTARDQRPAPMSEPATFSVEIHGAVIHAVGVLDELTVDLVLAAADFLFYRGHREVTIDLGAITCLMPSAVGALCRVPDGHAAGHHLHLLVPAHLRSGQLGAPVADPLIASA